MTRHIIIAIALCLIGAASWAQTSSRATISAVDPQAAPSSTGNHVWYNTTKNMWYGFGYGSWKPIASPPDTVNITQGYGLLIQSGALNNYTIDIDSATVFADILARTTNICEYDSTTGIFYSTINGILDTTIIPIPDNDPNNEVQTLTLSNDSIKLNMGGGTVLVGNILSQTTNDISYNPAAREVTTNINGVVDTMYLPPQTLSFTAPNLSLTGGGTVNLSGLIPATTNTLSWNATSGVFTSIVNGTTANITLPRVSASSPLENGVGNTRTGAIGTAATNIFAAWNHQHPLTRISPIPTLTNIVVTGRGQFSSQVVLSSFSTEETISYTVSLSWQTINAAGSTVGLVLPTIPGYTLMYATATTFDNSGNSLNTTRMLGGLIVNGTNNNWVGQVATNNRNMVTEYQLIYALN